MNLIIKPLLFLLAAIAFSACTPAPENLIKSRFRINKEVIPLPENLVGHLKLQVASGCFDTILVLIIKPKRGSLLLKLNSIYEILITPNGIEINGKEIEGSSGKAILFSVNSHSLLTKEMGEPYIICDSFAARKAIEKIPIEKNESGDWDFDILFVPSSDFECDYSRSYISPNWY